MKKYMLIIALLIAALAVSSCGGSEQIAPSSRSEPVSGNAQTAIDDVSDKPNVEVEAPTASESPSELAAEEPISSGTENENSISPISAWIEGTSVNLRAEPSTEANVLAVLSDKQEIALLSEADNWGLVRAGNKEGYVNLAFVVTDNIDGSTVSAEKAVDEQPADIANSGKAWVDGVSVNFRSAPSRTATIISVLKYGQAMELLGQSGEWKRVSVNGKEGYVSAEFVTTDKIEEAAPAPQTTAPVYNQNAGGLTIAIDPGHQARANNEYEPIGPGASESKPKVSSGTQSVTTKLPEYKLTLEVSLKLRDELISRGYNVVMIRETNEVNISNRERAEIATNAGADILVRIHTDGSENSGVNGILTLCPSKGNPFIPHLYEQCRALSDDILSAMVTATGAKNRGVSEVNNMSGINWSTIPVTIIEMGLMTNPAEDKLMQTEEYQQKLVLGIANGIDSYFTR